jgi:hypothetical protein
MEWRCYCPETLLGAKYTYDFSAVSTSYYSKNKALTSIN